MTAQPLTLHLHLPRTNPSTGMGPGFTLDVKLELPAQGCTALYGPSGCGKTTLLRCIAGLERARGQVRLGEQVWQDDAQGQWLPTHRRGLGYVFQEASLFTHLDVAANIRFGLQRTPAARRKVDGQALVQLLGIEHLLARPVATLSGGERQRVAIARALATSPQLLLMDEPLAALDPARKAEVLPYLEALQRNLSIPMLYVSHAPQEVLQLADRVVLLRQGRVQQWGDTAQLLGQLDHPLGDAATALICGHIQAHDTDQHLSTIAFADGILLLPAALHLPLGSAVRIGVAARDVSLSLAPLPHSSILNSLPAHITGLRPDGDGQVLVALAVGSTALLARISQRSAQQLALTPGQAVWAHVKGIALLRGG